MAGASTIERSLRPSRRSLRRSSGAKRAGVGALGLGSLGVVFGDIGTSPLYAIQTVFNGAGVGTERLAVYGVISLVVWAVILVVSVKYVTFVMRADNEGEGGIMSLLALAQRVSVRRPKAKAGLLALGVLGAALFYGDGMITPAISVLSAMEGLEVAAPSLEQLVIPLTLTVLVGLFAIQRFGTAVVGRCFGPVMAIWFLAIGTAGAVQVASDPGILAALSPTHGAAFLIAEPGVGFFALGAVVLVVTGAEALYADMGHFGRKPIRLAWFGVVFPALTLNYLGQGSLVLGDSSTASNPFFLLLPEGLRIPMVVLAAAATIIASQALISGAFSITRQAVQLGYLPRLIVRHTSEHEPGQIYMPAVNWALLAGVVAIVVGFGSAASLASAYGVAVTGTFIFTTVLFLFVARRRWRVAMWKVVLGGAVFGLLDLVFFTSNLTKVHEGGWLPLTIGALIFLGLATWHRGQEIVTANRTRREGSLREFVEEVHETGVNRVPGTGVFLNANPETTPLAMRAAVSHHGALHENAIILSVEIARTPHVDPAERLRIDDLGFADDGITHVTARFGFSDRPDVPVALEPAREELGELDPSRASYFLSRITIVPTHEGGMAMWRKRLFVVMARNAASPVDYFGLPADRTVVTGAQIAL